MSCRPKVRPRCPGPGRTGRDNSEPPGSTTDLQRSRHFPKRRTPKRPWPCRKHAAPCLRPFLSADRLDIDTIPAHISCIGSGRLRASIQGSSFIRPLPALKSICLPLHERARGRAPETATSPISPVGSPHPRPAAGTFAIVPCAAGKHGKPGHRQGPASAGPTGRL